jgi:hypothetical protein
MMHRAGAYPFSSSEDSSPGAVGFPPGTTGDSYVRRYMTFDKYGTFELRYARYRRSSESRDALPYQGEFDQELHR